MNLLTSGVGFGLGLGFGAVGGAVIGDKLPLNAFGVNCAKKRIALFVLHIFCAMAAVSLYFAAPSMGLSFIAIRIVQGALIPVLLVSGLYLQDLALEIADNEDDKTANHLGSLNIAALFLSIVGVPMVLTTSAIGLGYHAYNWWSFES